MSEDDTSKSNKTGAGCVLLVTVHQVGVVYQGQRLLT